MAHEHRAIPQLARIHGDRIDPRVPPHLAPQGRGPESDLQPGHCADPALVIGGSIRVSRPHPRDTPPFTRKDFTIGANAGKFASRRDFWP